MLELFYHFGSIDNVECDLYVELSVITVYLAEMLLMPVIWRDLSAWLVALENIHMKHVICPVLVTTISPLMRVLQRLMAISDETMCYLRLTTVGLLSTFWCPLIRLSLLFTLYFSSLIFLSLFSQTSFLIPKHRALCLGCTGWDILV